MSQATYDEIEKLLLEAGYDHLFERGPGSLIDLGGFMLGPKPEQQTSLIQCVYWMK